MATQHVDFVMKDASDNGDTQKGYIEISSNMIMIHFDGYGEKNSADESGEPILVEVLDGTPRIIVFGNITSDEPTHIIYLDEAKIIDRQEEQ